ncbi:hypothetical protein ACS0TY_004642 [Phlomoides rotata]
MGCLGALDGTYIHVKVSQPDVPHYRNWKGNISVNVLVVCDRDMNYVYVLSGWEGSAADNRILCDAVTRTNGLKVPTGNNSIMIMHLNNSLWLVIITYDGGYTNDNGFLTPYRGVRAHMSVDPYEAEVPESFNDVNDDTNTTEAFINQVEPSHAWTSWWDNLAIQIIEGRTNLTPGGRVRKRVVPTSRQSGYLLLLENAMSLKFQGTDLKGDPHINSKIHVWKKQYTCLKSMLGVSGIGLNGTTYHIDALPEVWEAYVKVDPIARGMKNKTFPFY